MTKHTDSCEPAATRRCEGRCATATLCRSTRYRTQGLSHGLELTSLWMRLYEDQRPRQSGSTIASSDVLLPVAEADDLPLDERRGLEFPGSTLRTSAE